MVLITGDSGSTLGRLYPGNETMIPARAEERAYKDGGQKVIPTSLLHATPPFHPPTARVRNSHADIHRSSTRSEAPVGLESGLWTPTAVERRMGGF
jgi:hypothetical protein